MIENLLSNAKILFPDRTTLYRQSINHYFQYFLNIQNLHKF